MTAPAATMTRATRLTGLEVLACLEDEGIERALLTGLLTSLAVPFPTLEALWAAWNQYLWARKCNTDMQIDGGYWAVYFPGLTVVDRVETAREYAAQMLEAAEHELLGGN